MLACYAQDREASAMVAKTNERETNKSASMGMEEASSTAAETNERKTFDRV
jgi:hypothetical protein